VFDTPGLNENALEDGKYLNDMIIKLRNEGSIHAFLVTIDVSTRCNENHVRLFRLC